MQGAAGQSTESPALASRLPVLDGVRAIAISLVVAGHFNYFSRFHAAGVITASFGVALFFVLSGYLITRSMLLDEKRYGQLSLGKFYRRRALRIFPAFYTYLLIAGVLSYWGLVTPPDRHSWLASAAYFRNLTGSGWTTGHLWSLALEEQFYLVWPALFILTRRFRLPAIGVAVLLFTCWRALWIAGHQGQPPIVEDPGGLHWRPDLRLDTFLIGGAFAIADWKWVRTAPALLTTAFLLLWYYRAIGFPILQPVESVVTAVLLATLIAWIIQNPGSSASRILSNPISVTIGTLSYSIYLWQQLFLGPNAGWWSLPLLGTAAYLSWRLVERPFLRLRNRSRTMIPPAVCHGANEPMRLAPAVSADAV